MEDREYSAPGAEFSAPGRELSPPGREFSSAGAEWAGPGREFARRNRDDPPPRRKRRVSPLMLTAAAVATAAVVFSGSAAPVPARSEYPVCEITAQHREYLNAVCQALEDGDLELLQVLDQDPTLRDLVVNYVAPYAHRMEENCGLDNLRFETYYSNGVEVSYAEGGHYNVYYDGERLGVFESLGYQRGDPWLSFDYALYDNSEHPRQYIYFEIPGFSPIGVEPVHSMRYCHNSYKTGKKWGSWDSIFWYDELIEPVEFEGTQFNVAVQGRYYHKSVYDNVLEEEWLEGEYATVYGSYPDGGNHRIYLENGTAGFFRQDENGTASAECSVQDGRVILNGQAFVAPPGQIYQDDYVLWAPYSNGEPCVLLYGEGTSEADFLYHLFQRYNYI